VTKIVKKEAKTVDEAVRLALAELGVPAEKAMVDILDEGKPGILGFGAKNALVEVSYEETTADRIQDFLRPILDKMGISPEIDITENEEQLSVRMQGENSGIAIGRRGETLDALQYLTSLVVNRGAETYTRVIMDVSDYRLKREETLVRLAQRVGEKVQKTRRSVTLEPMNPYERRIIHSALQGVKDVETGSVGEEPNRKVVVRSTRAGYAGQESSGEERARPSSNRTRPPRTPEEPHPQGEVRREARQVAFGSRAPGFNPSSPHDNPNSYRNRSTERIGYEGNPTASGSAKHTEEPAFKPYDIEDELGPQE
jgi:spoIIIJ-associated protein